MNSSSFLLKWKGNGILLLLEFSSSFIQRNPCIDYFIFKLCSVQLSSSILQAAGRDIRECCDSAQHGLRRAALFWSLRENGNTLWNSTIAFIGARAIWYVGVYFIALHMFVALELFIHTLEIADTCFFG